jgi:hypothetical protein
MTTVSPLLVGSTANRSTNDRPHRPPASGTATTTPQDQLWSVLTGREAARPSVLGLPLAMGLATLDRSVAAHYAITPMEVRGRLGDRSPVRVLDWRPGLRVSISPMAGVILIRPDATCTDAIGPLGYVRLTSRVRYACHLNAGDRLLMVARPDLDVLLIYTMASLDAMILADATGRQGAA